MSFSSTTVASMDHNFSALKGDKLGADDHAINLRIVNTLANIPEIEYRQSESDLLKQIQNLKNSDLSSESESQSKFEVAESHYGADTFGQIKSTLLDSLLPSNIVEYQPKIFGKECPICLIDFIDGENLKRFSPCGHLFHEECIRKHVQKKILQQQVKDNHNHSEAQAQATENYSSNVSGNQDNEERIKRILIQEMTSTSQDSDFLIEILQSEDFSAKDYPYLAMRLDEIKAREQNTEISSNHIDGNTNAVTTNIQTETVTEKSQQQLSFQCPVCRQEQTRPGTDRRSFYLQRGPRQVCTINEAKSNSPSKSLSLSEKCLDQKICGHDVGPYRIGERETVTAAAENNDIDSFEQNLVSEVTVTTSNRTSIVNSTAEEYILKRLATVADDAHTRKDSFTFSFNASKLWDELVVEHDLNLKSSTILVTD